MTAGFEKWVEAVFDHPVGKPEWYWTPEFEAQWESLEVSGPVTVAYLTRLYSDASILRRFSLEQVAQGIWFLVGESSPAKPSYSLLDPSIPLQTRVACVSVMAVFFRHLVAVAAPGPADTETNPFHIACYMWWDIFPGRRATKARELHQAWLAVMAETLSLLPSEVCQLSALHDWEPELDQACLAVMAETLSLPSEVCQLSALHGLNHWYLTYGGHVEQTVDAFLAASHDLSPRIREYAALARHGKAQ